VLALWTDVVEARDCGRFLALAAAPRAAAESAENIIVNHNKIISRKIGGSECHSNSIDECAPTYLVPCCEAVVVSIGKERTSIRQQNIGRSRKTPPSQTLKGAKREQVNNACRILSDLSPRDFTGIPDPIQVAAAWWSWAFFLVRCVKLLLSLFSVARPTRVGGDGGEERKKKNE
jgi:hypothetical protein